jgi:hypothetical protein
VKVLAAAIAKRKNADTPRTDDAADRLQTLAVFL